MGVSAAWSAEADPEGFDLDFLVDGVRRRRSLAAGWDVAFEAVEPVRGFRWGAGVRGFAGWYYSATMRDHVGYESWLERDRLILLDRDPEVVGVSSQPFWLRWEDEGGGRRHAPDYFVRLADGRARVVDVRAAADMDEAARDAFAVTARACAAVSWEFEWVGRPDPVFMANVRWLARFRRARCGGPPGLAARLLEVFDEPRQLWEGAGLAGDRLHVLPALFHLLWSGGLETDLVGGLMAADSVVAARRRSWAG